MPIEGKVMFTVFAGVVTSLILFLKMTSGPDSHWPLGRKQPIRNLLFRNDGSLRKYSKLGMLLWIWGVVAVIWLVA